jgi:hypothetical protein
MSVTFQVRVLYDAHLDITELRAELRIPGDQRRTTASLPMHLADAYPVNEGAQSFPDGSSNSKSLFLTPSLKYYGFYNFDSE